MMADFRKSNAKMVHMGNLISAIDLIKFLEEIFGPFSSAK